MLVFGVVWFGWLGLFWFGWLGYLGFFSVCVWVSVFWGFFGWCFFVGGFCVIGGFFLVEVFLLSSCCFSYLGITSSHTSVVQPRGGSIRL